MPHSFLCPNCGLNLDVPADWERPKIRCRECGVIAEVPEAIRKSLANSARKRQERPGPAPSPRPPSDVLPKITTPPSPPAPNYAEVYIWSVSDDEENSDPYAAADPERPRCPECQSRLEFDAVVCPRCGFDQRDGRRYVREYTTMIEHWEAGMPLTRRLFVFFLGQVGTILFGLLGAKLAGDWVAFFAPWVIFTLLTAFLLGTYDRIDLTRDRRGRAELIRSWRICFFPCPPGPIDLREYEGISTSKYHDAGLVEWLIFLSLLPGLFPAFLWWWFAIRPATVQVALTRDHGYAALILYRGWNEEQALEMAHKLSDAAQLRYTGL